MKNFLICRNRYGLRGIDHSFDISPHNFTVSNRYDSMRIHAADMAARNASVDRMYLATCHELGFLDRALNRFDRRFDINHSPLLKTARAMAANTNNIQTTVRVNISDYCYNL